MDVSKEQLAALYERLIRQCSHLDGVCPSERILVDYESGLLSAEQTKQVDTQLAQCSLCREEHLALVQAGRWFRQNERAVITGLAAKGAAAGILPWSRCPSVGLLYRYLCREIPATPGGKILHAEIEEHLDHCQFCRQLQDEFLPATQSSPISLLELGKMTAGAILDRLHAFGDALVAAAEVIGTVNIMRGAPGFRGTEMGFLDAPLLNENHQVVVDEQGQAPLVRFEVFNAQIQSDGFTVVDVSIADSRHLQRMANTCKAQLTLWAEGVRIEFPATRINEEGRVTFTGKIPQCGQIASLPLCALDMVVIEPA